MAKKATKKKPAKKKPAKKKTTKKKATKKKTTKKKATKKKTTKKKTTKKKPAKKKTAKKKTTKKKPAMKATGKDLVNRIALVVDRSGSMWSLKKKVISVFNQQLKTIQSNAKKSTQMTYISVYTFATRVDRPKFKDKRAETIPKLTAKDYKPSGATALLDATGTAITDLTRVKKTKGDESYLVIVMTDGYDNYSRKYKRTLGKTIRSVQKTGRWSIAFLTPKGGVSHMKRLGIPAGNIQSWDATTKGVEKASKSVQKGIDNFYKARSAGKRATTGFFTTSMKDVNVKNIGAKLKDQSKGFHVWSVNKAAPIRKFVDGKQGAGSYKAGNGFYELTKSETIHAGKELLIMDKKGRIYGGSAGRALVGLPDGRIRVKPGDHGEYRLFVMSTSVNRKLVAGTRLLYRK